MPIVEPSNLSSNSGGQLTLLSATDDECLGSPGFIGCSGSGNGDEVTIGDLVQNREMLLGKIVRGENTYDTLSEELLLHDSIFAYKQLNRFETLMYLQTEEDSLYQKFYNFCKQRNIGKFEQVNQYVVDSAFTHIDEAEITNQNIPTTNTIEANQQIVNAIYINKMKYENDTIKPNGKQYEFSEEEIGQLQLVAYQHPALGGDAVYQARILLWIEVEDDLTLVTKKMTNKPSPKVVSDLKLYPNPNDGNMTLNYNLSDSETGEITIYNVLGEKVSTYKLQSNATTINIKETNFKNGIYFYKIMVNDKPIHSDKIIINK